MEETFKVLIGMGKPLPVFLIWVEVPVYMRDRSIVWFGNDPKARKNFEEHFQSIADDIFTDLDMLIHEEIEAWIQSHDVGNYPEYLLHFYTLCSPWFEC